MASGLLLAPMAVDAAGLGDITVHSQLGQPLRAEVRVTATSDELTGMVAHLASQNAYQQSGARYLPVARQLRFTLEKAAGGAVIKVTSEKPINDPFMDFMLELSWPAGRLTREYTFLIDPQDLQVKSSGVAPTPPKAVGAAPSAAAPIAAPQANRAAAAGEHVVKPGETLYRIAAENLPVGVTLEQMQVALYRNNPGAFDGSISRLRAGSVLKIPAQADVISISRNEAQKALGAPSAASSGTSNAGGSGKGGASVAASSRQAVKPNASTEKELADRKKNIDEFNNRVNNLKQEVDTLQEQVKSKDEELARIEKLKAEKKAALETAAAAQPTVKTPEVVAPPEVSSSPPVGNEETPVVPGDSPAGEIIANTSPEDEISGEEPKTVSEPPPVPTLPPSARSPVQLDTQEPEEESGGGLIWILGGAGALVVLLLGFLFLRRRGGDDGDTLSATSIAASNIEPFSASFSTKGPTSVFQNAGGQSVDTSNTTAPPVSEFSQAGLGAIDTDEVDPVAEADVYMAYGRDGQAEEILLDALQKDPHRLAIPVKLLEVYASRKNVKDFETLATELYTQTGGKGAEWEKVLSLGSALDPSNPLYGGSGGKGTAGAAAPSSLESEAAISSLLEQDAEPPEFDFLTTSLAESAQPQPDVPDDSGVFSFALESSNPASPPEAASSPVEVAAPEEDDPLLSLLQEEAVTGAEDDRELLGGETEVVSSVTENRTAPPDFDFDIEKSEPIPAPRTAPTPSPESAPAQQEPSTISQAILDFDLGGDSRAPASASEQPYDVPEDNIAATDSDIATTVVNPDAILSDTTDSGGEKKQAANENLVDFELEIPDVVTPHAVAQDEMDSDEMAATSIMSIEPDDDMEFDVHLTESTVLGSPSGTTSFGLSGINLELGANAAPAPTPAAEPEPLAADLDEIESDEGGAISDSRRDEVNTKLDLAKAYEEMGDLEGARELLGEVVGEGAPDQIAEAQTMLTRLNV
ncbi:MAG: LysM peptidoglycan-binding domain-containing protein [Zoogloeaceae bacterium]|nr:LysM peptidoglycan-binding domain-containing protein [Zoogloeaceae bacterium]